MCTLPYSGKFLMVRNYHASVKMATEPTLSLWQWSEGKRGHVLPGRLDCLSSNRIQTLLWGFSARPSLLLSISNCSVLLVLE